MPVYVDRTVFAFVVGHGGAAAGRRLVVHRARLFLSLHLDRVAAGLAGGKRTASAGLYWPLASAAAFIASSAAMLFSAKMLTKARELWELAGMSGDRGRNPHDARRGSSFEFQGHWQSGLRPYHQQLWRAGLRGDRRRGAVCRDRGHHGALHTRPQRRRQCSRRCGGSHSTTPCSFGTTRWARDCWAC